MLPRRLLLATVVLAASCRGGCHRVEDRAATVEGRLALFPFAAQIVVAVDVTRLRASPAAAKLVGLVSEAQSDKGLLAEVARRTGLDLARQVTSVTLAFPEDARIKGELGLLLRADHLDEKRLVAYAGDELRKKGDELRSKRQGKFTLWWARSNPNLAGFFIDEQTFALGGGGWAERMADLAESARASDSAATHVELVRLVERIAAGHAIWGAAIVPASTRSMLMADPRFASAAAVSTLSAALDIGKGLDALILADLGTPAEARALASKVTESLRDAKRNAQVLILGLGPYVDGVTARANGRTFEARAALGEAALDDLLARLRAYLTLVREGTPPGFGGPSR